MIKHVSLKHGWYYHYRLHSARIEGLPKRLGQLRNYLTKVFDNCPEEHFLTGPRSSALKFDLGIDLMHAPGHEVCSFAKAALDQDIKLSAHTKVQKFMLDNDAKTLTTEVPLWLNSGELNKFEDIFDDKDPLSGHIDLVRFENNNIWIWDFKPNAAKENYASTQVFFYALMLSQRTQIPLDNFCCGYFDEKDAYIFKPDLAHLKQFNVANM